MKPQWCVFYIDWGMPMVKRFGDDEEAARNFALITEDSRVCYGLY